MPLVQKGHVHIPLFPKLFSLLPACTLFTGMNLDATSTIETIFTPSFFSNKYERKRTQ